MEQIYFYCLLPSRSGTLGSRQVGRFPHFIFQHWVRTKMERSTKWITVTPWGLVWFLINLKSAFTFIFKIGVTDIQDKRANFHKHWKIHAQYMCFMYMHKYTSKRDFKLYFIKTRNSKIPKQILNYKKLIQNALYFVNKMKYYQSWNRIKLF